MRIRLLSAALVALALPVASCSDSWVVNPLTKTAARFATASSLPAVRFSEIHYDNNGTDVGEAIEVSGPAGTDLTGWSIVLYNGNGGASYTTSPLSGTIPATCGARGVVVVNYPSNGIQNGSPDGMALVNGTTVVEFLSYEGVFAATNGPALGVTSTDIGVSEVGTEVPGLSLQRSGTGTWSSPTASTFGTCNDADAVTPDIATIVLSPSAATINQGDTQQFTGYALDAQDNVIDGVAFTYSSTAPTIVSIDATGLARGLQGGDAQIIAVAANGMADTSDIHVDGTTQVGLPPVRFSELHYDNSGTDVGEAIEIEGPAGTDLTGWSVVLYDGNGGGTYNTAALSGTIASMCNGRGVVVVNYPTNGIQNGSPDAMALVNNTGGVVEFLSYEGVMTAANGPAATMVSTDIGVSEPSTSPVGQSLQRDPDGVWHAPAAATFGACYGATPVSTGSISFSGRLPSDPALPVGYQDQIFATVRDGSGATVSSTITWSSETPTIASIDQNGVMTALDAGTATVRATAANGTTATYSLPTRVAVASTTALYAGNTEFGVPADADASDDYIVTYPQYTASFNHNRGTPNWVSYDLDATHFGAEDRCDCFTFDPALPSSFTRYTTADYTGAGTAAGYGIDRGHLARSFDRTSASLDNAHTFLFTNIVPQAADLNQGPWAAMEAYLGDLARLQNKEVYIITGVAGSKGTLKNEGKITIPAQMWKVAVIMPRDQGLANVHRYTDLQVIAAIMPNDPGVRNVNWETYETTVDAVEALSGYDLLSLLPDPVEIAVESNTKPPVAALDGPYSSLEGSSVSMSGSASSDPDGDALTYAWTFGDGGVATGASVSHTYMQDGSYSVRLIVTDIRGLSDTTFTTASVANVAPSIASFAGATLLPGETYSAIGSFTDPGADSWGATVDYGDGSGSNPLALALKTFSLSHVYAEAGTFTVTVRVYDGTVTSTRTQTVVVLTPSQAAQSAITIVRGLVSGGALNGGRGNSLIVKLDAAKSQLDRGNTIPAVQQLEAELNELDAMVRAGTLDPSDAAPLRTMVVRIISSIS